MYIQDRGTQSQGPSKSCARVQRAGVCECVHIWHYCLNAREPKHAMGAKWKLLWLPRGRAPIAGVKLLDCRYSGVGVFV